MMQPAAVVSAISIDYSDDELDAIAAAFSRPDLARRAERVGGDPIRRAQQQTALRGLVARHAIALSGTPTRPRIEFLEPHATMLGAFLQAQAVATVRREAREETRAVSLFAHDEVVVHQASLPAQAIQRMTAHGRDAAAAVLSAELALPQRPAEPVQRGAVELTRRMVQTTLDAIAARQSIPVGVPPAAADILHARIASGSVAITSRDRVGTRSAEKWAWIDAGDVGLWRVRTSADSPMVTFLPAETVSLAAEIDYAWSLALAGSAQTAPPDFASAGSDEEDRAVEVQ